MVRFHLAYVLCFMLAGLNQVRRDSEYRGTEFSFSNPLPSSMESPNRSILCSTLSRTGQLFLSECFHGAETRLTQLNFCHKHRGSCFKSQEKERNKWIMDYSQSREMRMSKPKDRKYRENQLLEKEKCSTKKWAAEM
jgi:hypothetical protein